MKRAVGAALLFGVWVSGSGALAQTAPAAAGSEGVVVLPATCGALPWSAETWMDLLRVELAADGISVGLAATGSAVPRVAIEPAKCDGSVTSATLTFTSGDVRRTRTLQLSDVEPVARPRVLAIAMADVIRLGLADVKKPPPGAPAPPQELSVRLQLEGPVDAARPLPPMPEAPSRRSSSLFVAGETKVFAHESSGLFGARAGAQLQLSEEVALLTDAGVLRGSAHNPLGDVDATVGTVGVGLLGTGGTGDLSFGVGPRIEAGVGWFRGRATAPLASASSAASPLVFFALSGAASFRIRGTFWGFVGLDAGTSLYGFAARSDDRQVSDSRGPMLATRVGFLWTVNPPSVTK